MNAKTRLERLERTAAPQGHCPHLSAVVSCFEADGTQLTARGTQDETPCACGRDRLRIRVEFVEKPRNADELKAAELDAIIARGA